MSNFQREARSEASRRWPHVEDDWRVGFTDGADWAVAHVVAQFVLGHEPALDVSDGPLAGETVCVSCHEEYPCDVLRVAGEFLPAGVIA